MESTGVVKFYSKWREYGFIIDDNTHEELYFDKTDLKQAVTQNLRVTYQILTGQPPKRRATKIKNWQP